MTDAQKHEIEKINSILLQDGQNESALAAVAEMTCSDCGCICDDEDMDNTSQINGVRVCGDCIRKIA